MYKIKLYNNIAPIGIQQFTADYEVGDDIENEDAILVRSANLHNIEYSDHLKCIARAGAGTNNIDIDACTQRGIVVFNTPGANSNAVKELVFAGMLLASRDIYGGISWAKTQQNNENYGCHSVRHQSHNGKHKTQNGRNAQRPGLRNTLRYEKYSQDISRRKGNEAERTQFGSHIL